MVSGFSSSGRPIGVGTVGTLARFNIAAKANHAKNFDPLAERPISSTGSAPWPHIWNRMYPASRDGAATV